MALYRFAAGIIGRSSGGSSTAAAAYRAGVCIADDRTGQTHDYTRRQGVLWSGIYAPQNAPEWARDRQQLWNRVEAAEKRKDAQLSREFVIALPHELTTEQNRYLLQDFIRENFTRKGFVADVSIHAPSRNGDDRNYHAHLMVTTRQLKGQEFDATKDRTQNKTETLEAWRESWERLGNRHLERHGHDATLDRRSWAAQGIDREARLHMGKLASALEARGTASGIGDENRAIDARNAEVAKLKAEIAELERLYRLENNKHLDGWTQGRAKRTELQAEPVQALSSVERQKAEDAADRAAVQKAADRADRRAASLPHHLREIFSALRTLGRTMGASLTHVIPGADRDALKAQIRAEWQARQKPQQTPTRSGQTPRSPEPAREFVKRGQSQRPPSRAMLQQLRRGAERQLEAQTKAQRRQPTMKDIQPKSDVEVVHHRLSDSNPDRRDPLRREQPMAVFTPGTPSLAETQRPIADNIQTPVLSEIRREEAAEMEAVHRGDQIQPVESPVEQMKREAREHGKELRELLAEREIDRYEELEL